MEKRIYLMLAGVVISWGLNVVAVKYLTEQAPMFSVAALRIIFAALAMLPFVWKGYGWFKLNARQWILIFLIGLTSVFINQIFLVWGLALTSAINAALILGLNPLSTALLAAIFLGEGLGWRLIAGIVLGFTGVVLAVASKSAEGGIAVAGWGDLVVLGSMLSYVIGSLFVKKLAGRIPALVITAYSTAIGAAMLGAADLGIYGARAFTSIDGDAFFWILMLFSAWVATALGNLGWNYGIQMLGAGRTAIFLNGLPFAGMAGAFLFLGEHLHWIHAFAFALTAAGIMLALHKRSGTGHTSKPSKPAKPKTPQLTS
ncbi:DMT family transporter [Ferviditalea candida]|uniref:DMT family transporter n=1 Tax=Ferviditalea candida TaxID=3108399 RepID=A0ABU5ZEE1_9BACL|nr:DMT family transporter [Paenibacillaceae bacterium T2]